MSIQPYAHENELIQAGDYAGLEEIILNAIADNDVQKLCQLVPVHYRMLRGKEREIIVRQAIDDWRIVYLGLWAESGASSAMAYFREMATGDIELSPVTRMANANAIQFFMVEQDWSISDLTQAGIGKMINYVGYCRRNAEERGGEMDPRLKDVMLDSEHVSIRQVLSTYRASNGSSQQANPDDKDEMDHRYKQYISAKTLPDKVVLEVWDPYPDDTSTQSVAVEIGELNLNTPLHQELVAKFLQGDLEIRGWLK